METPKNQEDVLKFAQMGEIVDGILIMPTLYSLNTRGKYLVWITYIGITFNNEEINEECDLLPVEQKHIEREDLPENAIGIYWTVSGVEGMAMKRSANKLIYQGKNLGKNNYTTPFTQAILSAKSDFDNRVRKGNKLRKSDLKKQGDVYTFEELCEDKTRDSHPWRVFAMAVHDYNKHKNHIEYPATLQYKLDGTLFIVVSHPSLPEIRVEVPHKMRYPDDYEPEYEKMHIDGYSRSRETYEGQDHILREIYPVAQKYPGLHFVGELWKKGYGLQEISGSSRRKADSKLKTSTVTMNFNIFDCFYIDSPEIGFVERQAILDDVFLDLSALKNKESHIARIPTHEVQNEKEMLQLYNGFVEQEGFEGGVIRNTNALYEFGINKEIRTYQSLKLKPRPDAEWPVVGFLHGKGKETDLVIWVCAENDAGVLKRTGKPLPLEERKTFNVTPNQKAELREHIFKKLSKDGNFFDEYIYGQSVVISYSILSTNYLPQQPKMLRFRDEKIDELLK